MNNKDNNVIIKEVKITANAQKLKDLENQMKFLEDNLLSLESKVNKSKEYNLKTNEEIYKLNEINTKLLNGINKNIKTKVEESFLDELKTLGLDKIPLLEKDNEELKNDLEKIKIENIELKKQIEVKNNINKECDLKYENLKNEYIALKELYEDLLHEKEKKEFIIEEKDIIIKNQKEEIDDVKSIIGRLTEVRVVLNKYFSAYFENFTPNERNVINDFKNSLENKGVMPEETGFVKYNNSNIYDYKENNVQNSLKNSNAIIQNKNNIVNNINDNNNSINKNSYEFYDNVNLNKISNNVVNTNNHNSYLNKNTNKNYDNNKNINNAYSKEKSNMYNVDDDFWYERNKKNN